MKTTAHHSSSGNQAACQIPATSTKSRRSHPLSVKDGPLESHSSDKSHVAGHRAGGEGKDWKGARKGTWESQGTASRMH